MDSSCSCPVGFGCKHAVASVVAALECIEGGEELPLVAADDIRWDLAAGITACAAKESSA